MANLLINTALRFLGSKQPTSLMRMKDISQVSVLLDSDSEDVLGADDIIKEYFAGKGIQLVFYPVRSKKLIRAHKDTQVLLSLVPRNSWHLEYVVRRSRARFKIGRFQLPGNVFDLVVSDPEGESYPQAEVFGRMMELVENLK